MKKYFVYILKCSDNSYCTGITDNLERRISEQKSGNNPACYTFKRRPLNLVYTHEFVNQNDGAAFEQRIKEWPKEKKEALIDGDYIKIVRLSAPKKRHQRSAR